MNCPYGDNKDVLAYLPANGLRGKWITKNDAQLKK
jgi:hypothetical protein